MSTHPKDPQGVPLRTASSRVPRISLSCHVLFPDQCRVAEPLVWGRRDTTSLPGLGKVNMKWSKSQEQSPVHATTDCHSWQASGKRGYRCWPCSHSAETGLSLNPSMVVGSLVHSRLAGPGSRREHFDIPTYPSQRVRASGRFPVAKTRPYSILAPRASGGWLFFQWTLCVSILACAALGNLPCYICRASRWSSQTAS